MTTTTTPVTPDRTNVRTTLVIVAAVLAVAFWSLKPVFVTALGPKIGFSEVYLAAGTIAVGCSLLASLIMGRKTRAVFTAGATTWKGIGWAAISGLFLAMWYYGFYRALYETPKADATVIAFTWPLIAAVAMRFISPGESSKLRPAQWVLVLLSFVGATAIAIGGEGGGSQERSPEIVWAFIAALGSGLYLPFAIKALHCFETVAKSKPLSTFYSISVANVASLSAVSLAMLVTSAQLDFSGIDAEALALLALIGLGTYLVAEISWTWAFQEFKSLTLATLPYFSPAVSVLLLFLIFGEQAGPITIIGLLLILASNLVLHLWKR